jgi:hypothetical protein
VQQLRSFCARVAAKDAGFLRAHVQFPLVRRINASGDRCSSGDVPCEYHAVSIADPAALIRARPCGALDFSDPPRIAEVGTNWVVDATVGQMPDWLWFTSSPDGNALLLQWDAERGP